MDDVDELLGGGRARVVGSGARIDHVLANMIFNHFRDEAIEGSTARGRLLQYISAFQTGVDRPLDRLDLAAQPLEPVQQLGFFSLDVTHCKNSYCPSIGG